jgi:CRISPR-associated endonuclease/helicase Cas3
MAGEVYAHSVDGRPESEWEPLREHLKKVGALAARHAAAFSSSEWGRFAGLWHDLGKYHTRFQARLRDNRITQGHSGAGAVLACHRISKLLVAEALAAVIAGHHAGLANRRENNGEGMPSPLYERLATAKKEEWPGVAEVAPRDLLDAPLPELPSWVGDQKGLTNSQVGYRAEMWTRFLFSALVDADRLATEQFCNPAVAGLRPTSDTSMAALLEKLEGSVARLEASLTDEQRGRPVNKARREISEACVAAAATPPGLFSLTVPTGGGKTLAAMRFALRHAVAHSKRRVIVVIPYTSIIEQNAAKYAEIFGAEHVLEHHSNLDVEKRRDELGASISTAQELAAENWDAPIIVTTTVQFFESLFTNHPSRARKLHNVAQSVIILDEVQSLPPEFLLPILDGLKQLTSCYGCSVVLSTATPPALRERPKLPQGLVGVREIVADPVALARTLRRVEYQWPSADGPAVAWDSLAGELAGEHQVLAIVHQRKDARELATLLSERVDPATVFHLSALMCPAHRTARLAQVRAALATSRPCRLVSTQLIEAGVDVDFPVVYRAMAGLDSIVQAAGRCNREGRHATGRMVVFQPPSAPPAGVLRKGMEVTQTMLRRGNGVIDADDPGTQEQFFRRLYNVSSLDAKDVQHDRCECNFADVARKFKLIEDGFTHPVIVPWQEEGARRLKRLQQALEFGRAGREHFRAIQPYTVSVYSKAFQQAEKSGALVTICEGLHALSPAHLEHYSEQYGLMICDEIGLMNVGLLIQ